MNIYNTHINNIGVRWAHVIAKAMKYILAGVPMASRNSRNQQHKYKRRIQQILTTTKKETQRKIKCEIWLTLIGYGQNIKRMARKTIARRSVAFSTRNAITWTFSFTKSNQKPPLCAFFTVFLPNFLSLLLLL